VVKREREYLVAETSSEWAMKLFSGIETQVEQEREMSLQKKIREVLVYFHLLTKDLCFFNYLFYFLQI
jgi:hypothetical protein